MYFVLVFIYKYNLYYTLLRIIITLFYCDGANLSVRRRRLLDVLYIFVFFFFFILLRTVSNRPNRVCLPSNSLSPLLSYTGCVHSVGATHSYTYTHTHNHDDDGNVNGFQIISRNDEKQKQKRTHGKVIINYNTTKQIRFLRARIRRVLQVYEQKTKKIHHRCLILNNVRLFFSLIWTTTRIRADIIIIIIRRNLYVSTYNIIMVTAERLRDVHKYQLYFIRTTRLVFYIIYLHTCFVNGT